jgi:hypothetical protein
VRVSVKITAAERDALFEQIHARLSGIDEVWSAAATEEWERADQAARDFADDLRLIVDDLGWGEAGGEELELTSPPEVLRRVLTRMQKRGEERREVEEEERADLDRREKRTDQLLGVCRRVLGELSEA